MTKVRGDTARTVSALRREAAIYRRVLEETLALALNRLLKQADDSLAYQVTELVGEALRRKRPAGTGGK